MDTSAINALAEKPEVLIKVVLSRLTQADYDAFHAKAAEEGVSKAEVIRGGIDRFIGKS